MKLVVRLDFDLSLAYLASAVFPSTGLDGFIDGKTAIAQYVLRKYRQLILRNLDVLAGYIAAKA